MYKLICLLTLVPFAMGQSLNVADHSASDSPLSFPQAKVEPGSAANSAHFKSTTTIAMVSSPILCASTW